jgi:hypothetical protein
VTLMLICLSCSGVPGRRRARPSPAGIPAGGRRASEVAVHVQKGGADAKDHGARSDDARWSSVTISRETRPGPEAVTRALFALHATDSASVYLSVLARSATSTLADVAAAMYEQRSLVRWMAMRRTLFVFTRADIPTVQAAVSTPLAATLRRRLISQLQRNGTEPAIDEDIGRWLARLEARTEAALTRRGTATGTQLADDEPGLRTRLLARAPSDRPQNVTTSVRTMMSADGRLVRATPTGPWTSRQHRWEPISRCWPQGLPPIDTAQAQRDLARGWLERFGPATIEDLQWWTGWNKTATRRALDGLPIEDIDLHGHLGMQLVRPTDNATDDLADEAPSPPTATLLPALDPTPMGWKNRDWMFGIDPSLIFDRAGNIGPTLWWDGEIIGSWATTPGGELRTQIVADRGAEARAAIDHAAARLHARFDDAVITPARSAPHSNRHSQPAATDQPTRRIRHLGRCTAIHPEALDDHLASASSSFGQCRRDGRLQPDPEV